MRSIFVRLRPDRMTTLPGGFAEHALEEIRTRVDLYLPRRRFLRTTVEGRNAVQVVDEVRSQRRKHVHAFGDVRIHLLLYQPGMEMTGVDDHETDIRLCAAKVTAVGRCCKQAGHEHHSQQRFHRGAS